MKKIIPAERASRVTYAIRDVVVEANKLKAQGKKILHLNIGDPNVYDFVTPAHLVEAVYTAMKKNLNNYADSAGIEEAREAIVKEAARDGIKGVTKNDVLISAGVSEGIEMAMNALLNPGENVLTPIPGYPVYSAIVNKIGAVHNRYNCIEEEGWQPDVDDIRKKINSKTKGIILINPNNPTGALYPKETLKEIIDIAREYNLLIFSDEIYSKILLDDDRHVSTASLANDIPILTFNGLSKNYIVPGWRVGWMIFSGPQELRADFQETVSKLARSRLSAPGPFQYAIKPALEGPQDHIPEMNRKLRQRRDLIYKRFNEIEGFSCTKPKGAFYAFPKIELDIKDDKQFIMDVLYKKHILAVFGSGFGYPKPDHFRIVFLPPMNVLEESLNKLEEYVKENYK
ncbi:MAG: aminotransferase class I/II-fold pyridoxal phosphate-dependent enzyme [Candidatus Aenigmarchaeota archaeon]|nr:aminotransferase class I/II-fold pyridoxal phosphate-dependent enzyme [Candidatus Aenigmarchaeota archaeon]